MKKSACPSCRKAGNDKHGDNLATYPDGGAWCFSCGYMVKSKNSMAASKTEKKRVKVPEYTVATDYMQLVYGVAPSTAEAWEVQEEGELDDDTGEVVPTGVVVFPYFDSTRSLVGVKRRDYYAELHDHKKKNDTIWYSGALEVFGLHMVKEHDSLIIVEGESDALKMWETCNEYADVIAIPGSSHAAKMQAHGVMLRRYKRVYVAVDADEAGRKLQGELRDMIPAYLFHLCNYSLFGAKDACELHNDEIPKLLERAVKPINTMVVTGNDMMSGYMAHRDEVDKYSFVSTGFDSLDDCLAGGIIPGDVVMLVAHTGVGKSTLSVDIAYNMLCEGHRVLYVPTEMSSYQTLTKFVERHLQMSTSSKRCTQEKITDTIEMLSGCLEMYNSEDYSWQNISDAICASMYTTGVSLVIIDVINNIENFNEWQNTAIMMTAINRLAAGNTADKRPPVAILLVAHTRYTDGKFAKRIGRSSVAGGTAVIRQVTTCIGMEMLDDEEGDTGHRSIRVVKPNRFRDSSVFKGALWYDAQTKSYYDGEYDD